MRFILVAITLLLPLVSRAQFLDFKKFEEGSYVLNISRDVRHPGQLKLHNGTKLLLKSPDGKKIKLKPEQVYSFRIGQHTYTTARDFRVQGGWGTEVDEVFVERIDSGRVILMSYEYEVGGAMSMGAGGMMTGGGSTSMQAYLLKFPQDDTYVSVQPAYYSTAGGNRFRDAVRPFLASRPDLVTLLNDKRIRMGNLPAVIRALNTGQSYSPVH